MLARVSVWIAMILCGLSMLMLIVTPIRRIDSAVPMMLGIPLLFVAIIGLNPHRRFLLIAGAAICSTLGMAFGTAKITRGLQGQGALDTNSLDSLSLGGSTLATWDARSPSPWWGLLLVGISMALVLGIDLFNRQRLSTESAPTLTTGE